MVSLLFCQHKLSGKYVLICRSKPFKFRMSPITDLVNFRATDLFPEETVNWGCEGYVSALKSEKNEDGEEVKYYEITEGSYIYRISELITGK